MHASGRRTVKPKEATATLHGVGAECLHACNQLPVGVVQGGEYIHTDGWAVTYTADAPTAAAAAAVVSSSSSSIPDPTDACIAACASGLNPPAGAARTDVPEAVAAVLISPKGSAMIEVLVLGS